jgi:hypothetical protein
MVSLRSGLIFAMIVKAWHVGVLGKIGPHRPCSYLATPPPACYLGLAYPLIHCAKQIETDGPLFHASVALRGSPARMAALSYKSPTEFGSRAYRTGSRFSLASFRIRERFVSCDRAAVSHGL